MVLYSIHQRQCRMHKFDVPRLPHLSEFLTERDKYIMDEPIQVRKGYSYKVMLGEVFTSHRLVS